MLGWTGGKNFLEMGLKLRVEYFFESMKNLARFIKATGGGPRSKFPFAHIL